MVIDELIIVEDGENKSVEGVTDGLIDVIKVSTGKNLLNKETSDVDYYINSSGEKKQSVGYGLTVTQKIYVKPSTEYVYSGMGDVTATTVARTGYQYDANDVPIKAIGSSNGGRVLFTTESNCYYIYLQYVNGSEEPMLEEGNQNTYYEPFGGRDYNFAKEKDQKGLSQVNCDNAVPEPIIDMRVMGESVQTGGQLFDKTKMLSGFLPLTGAYPTTNPSYPNATYQIIDIQAGHTVKVTYLGSNAEYGRIRYIDKDTNEVIGTIVGGVNTNNGYCISTTYYNNRFYNGEITAIKDFKLGVMVTETLPSDFDLQILSLTNLTPTPETPIPIESVGEKTKNILQLNNNTFKGTTAKVVSFENNSIVAQVDLNNDQATNIDPGSHYFSSGWLRLNYTFEVGKTYALSYNVEFLEQLVPYNFPVKNRVVYTLGEVSIDEEIGREVYVDGLNKIYKNKMVFTVLKENPSLDISCNSSKIRLSNIMIEEGSTVTEYEPYGYKVPVNVDGKNLYNPAWDSRFTLQEDGSYLSNMNIKADVNILGNEKLPVSVYNVSVKLKSPVGMNYRPRIYYVDGTIKEVYKPSTGDYVDFSFTTEEKEIETITWYYSGQSNQVQYKDFQIEKSPMQTDYEPYFEPTTTNIYLSEPLRKVGSYADYIDYKNKKVVRNIGSSLLTGSTSIKQHKVFDDLSISIRIDVLNVKALGNTPVSCLSNYYRSAEFNLWYNGTIKDACSSHTSVNDVVYIYDSRFTTVAEYTAFITECETNGNPVNIVYVLLTPTEETIDVPEILTERGTNYFEFDTEVSPSFASIKYWKQMGTDVDAEEIIQDGSTLLIGD